MPRTGATLHVRGHVRGLPLLVGCVGMAPGTPAEKTPHEPELGRTVEAANAGAPNHVRRRAAISRYPRTDCHDLCSVALGRLFAACEDGILSERRIACPCEMGQDKGKCEQN